MNLIRRPVGVTAVAAGLAVAALAGASASPAATAPPARFVAIKDSVMVTGNPSAGTYRSPRMSVEVVLAPRDPAGLTAELAAVYDPASRDYHRWLAQGQFAARYGPAAATRDAVASYLRGSGLAVLRSPSPFLVRAVGSSARVSAAFRTALSSYRSPSGERYFANSSAAQVPQALAPSVLGVVGLTDTVRLHPQLALPGKVRAGSAPGCEDRYPARKKLLKDLGELLVRYAGAPGCSGLTPSQLNSIYGAPHVGARGQGAGVTLAVFEQSAYRASDIEHWARTFYGPGTRPARRVTNARTS
jgi:subtilase family serine protease